MTTYSVLIGEVKQTPQDYDDSEYSEILKELKQIMAKIDEATTRKQEVVNV